MIKLDEIVSGFSYVGSSVKECKILNSIVSLGPDAQYSLELDFSTMLLPLNKEDPFRRGRVLLSIGCKVRSEADEDAKTDIDFVIEGEFSVSNEMSDEAFTKMLMVNGVSALYGIARSKLEVITALTYHQGKISFPMINVLELLKEKQEQESQKN
jgi:hypothetical protein